MIRLFTIGFTRKSAEAFFTALERAGVRRLVDVRLNNTSQLAGFTKRDDLRFFLRRMGIEYEHRPELAPTQEMLDAYRESGDWEAYAVHFTALLAERGVEASVPKERMDGACLLCSETTAEHCHRRLVAEYLAERWGGVEVVHLG